MNMYEKNPFFTLYPSFKVSTYQPVYPTTAGISNERKRCQRRGTPDGTASPVGLSPYKSTFRYEYECKDISTHTHIYIYILYKY